MGKKYVLCAGCFRSQSQTTKKQSYNPGEVHIRFDKLLKKLSNPCWGEEALPSCQSLRSFCEDPLRDLPELNTTWWRCRTAAVSSHRCIKHDDRAILCPPSPTARKPRKWSAYRLRMETYKPIQKNRSIWCEICGDLAYSLYTLIGSLLLYCPHNPVVADEALMMLLPSNSLTIMIIMYNNLYL